MTVVTHRPSQNYSPDVNTVDIYSVPVTSSSHHRHRTPPYPSYSDNIDQKFSGGLLPDAGESGIRHPEHQHQLQQLEPLGNKSRASGVIDMVALQQTGDSAGRSTVTSYPESFYSAAAVLTIAGIFVTLTLTASLAVCVFWRKTNTVFVLQKCEQQDYNDEFNDADDDDAPYTESDSDGPSASDQSSNRLPSSSSSSRSKRRFKAPRLLGAAAAAVRQTSHAGANKWLPVECEDTDASWLEWRQSSMLSLNGTGSRIRTLNDSSPETDIVGNRSKTVDGSRDNAMSMIALTTSISDHVINTCYRQISEPDSSRQTLQSGSNQRVAAAAAAAVVSATTVNCASAAETDFSIC